MSTLENTAEEVHYLEDLLFLSSDSRVTFQLDVKFRWENKSILNFDQLIDFNY